MQDDIAKEVASLLVTSLVAYYTIISETILETHYIAADSDGVSEKTRRKTKLLIDGFEAVQGNCLDSVFKFMDMRKAIDRTREHELLQSYPGMGGAAEAGRQGLVKELKADYIKQMDALRQEFPDSHLIDVTERPTEQFAWMLFGDLVEYDWIVCGWLDIWRELSRGLTPGVVNKLQEAYTLVHNFLQFMIQVDIEDWRTTHSQIGTIESEEFKQLSQAWDTYFSGNLAEDKTK